MALTSAEKVRAFRERQKLRAAGLLAEKEPPAPLHIPRTMALAEFVAGKEDGIEAFEWMQDQLGLPIDHFLKANPNDQHQEIEWSRNIIRDMETALSTITNFMNAYWIAEIDCEVDRLKRDEVGNPDTKDKALNQIVRLVEARKSLTKNYRLTLSNYDPRG